MSPARVFGILGIKGGVGKTTLTTNLGSALNESGKKVLIIDGNFDTPHLGISLGLISSGPTIHDVLNNKAPIFDSLYKHYSGFHIIPGSLNPSEVNPLSLKDKISELKDYFDVILIDSSPSLDRRMLGTMMASDELIVVSSPDYPTLSSTIHAVRIAKQRKTPITGIIINKSRGKKFELTIREIEETTGVPVIGMLKDDVKVLEALHHSLPTTIHAPKRKISKEYRRIGAKIMGDPLPETGLLKIKAKAKDLAGEIKKKLGFSKSNSTKKKSKTKKKAGKKKTNKQNKKGGKKNG